MNRADDCTLVDTWLDDWLAGRLPEEVARRVEEHVRACERCRRLAAILRDTEAHSGEAGEDAELLAAVLDRTTGGACGRAEQLLPALVDDELDADSREILEAHVSHCQACSRLLAALQEAAQILPAFAEIEPPLGFAAGVLSATTAAPRRSAFPRPVSHWWLKVLARPRASLELAYVGTVLIVVLVGNPVAAFHAARAQAGRLADSVPVARLADQLPVKDAAARTIGALLGDFTLAANAAVLELSERERQAHVLIDNIRTIVSDAIDWLTTIDVKRIIQDAWQVLQPRAQPAANDRPGGRRPAARGGR